MFTYDANGRQATSLTRYQASYGLQNTTLTRSFYRPDSLLDSTEVSSWGGNQWIPSGGEKRTYNGSGLLNQLLTYQGTAAPLYRTTYLYNASGKTAQTVQERWSSSDLSFGPNIRTTYSYAADGTLTQTVSEYWDSGMTAYVPNVRTDYTYVRYIRQQTCANISVVPGWNLLSVPLQASNASVDSVLGLSGLILEFTPEEGFAPRTTITPGRGFWYLSTYPNLTTVCGKQSSGPVFFRGGWNIIGVHNASVALTDISSTEGGLVFWGYENGYEIVTDSLRTGRAYWVQASTFGELTFPSVLGKRNAAVSAGVQPNWVQLTVRDSRGFGGTVYFASDGEDLQRYKMPPVPSSELPDVRFWGDLAVGRVAADEQLRLQGLVGPITVTSHGGSVLISSDSRLDAVEVIPGATVTLGASTSRLTVRAEASPSVPAAFELYQNFPNPFNPSTRIAFSLPLRTRILLDVYDMLGRHVARVADGEFDSGIHYVDFNAGGIGSGVYVYRLRAGTSVTQRKFTVLR